MKTTVIVVLLYCTASFIAAEEAETKDLVDITDSEDLERKHRKRKKHQNNNGGCGYGKTFGEKFFGLHDYTYVSAPVMNYFFGCGVAALPVAPVPVVPTFPVQSQGGHGHGGHGGHGGGHGGHGGGHGGHGSFGGGQGSFGGGHGSFGGGPGSFAGSYGVSNYGNYGNYGGFGGFNQPYQQQAFGQATYQRPLQGALSAAATGLGSALADYIARPRKTQKVINRQINQFLKPIYKLF